MPLHLPEMPRLNHTWLPMSRPVERETLGWDAPQLWGAGAMAGPSCLKEDIHACSRCLGRPGPSGNPTAQALRALASLDLKTVSPSQTQAPAGECGCAAVTVLDRTTARTGTHTHTRRHTYVHTHTHTQAHTCIHAHTRRHTYSCTHMHTHAGTHTHTCTHTQAHTCIHAHTRRHTHSFMHTHAGTVIHAHMHTHEGTLIHAHTCTYAGTHIRAHTFTPRQAVLMLFICSKVNGALLMCEHSSFFVCFFSLFFGGA